MNNFKTTVITAACAALTAAGVAPVAQAATTIGVTSSAATANCSAQYIYMSDKVIPAGSRRVVTSWTVNRPTAGSLALKLLGTGFFADEQVVGTSDLVNVAAGAHTMTTRIPVYGSQALNLALWHASTQECRVVAGGEEVSYSEDPILTNPLVGSSSFDLNRAPGDTWENGDPVVPIASNRLVVKVSVEADADADEFGDETQDQCPGAPGPVNGCTPVPPPAPAVPKPPCKIPALKGKTKAQALTALRAVGCTLGVVKSKKLKKFTKTQKKNRVRTQTVKAGSIVPADTVVGITINVKKKK